MTSVGALYIAEMIKSNTSIEDLNLRSNHFKADGGLAIAMAMDMNGRITSLDLSETALCEDDIGEGTGQVIESLADALTRHGTEA